MCVVVIVKLNYSKTYANHLPLVTFPRKGGDNSHLAWPTGSKGKSCLEYLGSCSLAEKKKKETTVIKQGIRREAEFIFLFLLVRKVWERAG